MQVHQLPCAQELLCHESLRMTFTTSKMNSLRTNVFFIKAPNGKSFLMKTKAAFQQPPDLEG